MAPPLALHDLPLEVLTHVCQQLGLRDLVRVSRSFKRFGHGGLQTVELPTESPVVAVLRELAFSCLELAPRTRPIGCRESWVAYLARCARQRRCREAPPIAAGEEHILLLDADGPLLACGASAAVGHDLGDEERHLDATPVAAIAGVRVRSVAAGDCHSLALGWDGRVYSWGENGYGQLGQGDRLTKPAPALVEGLEGVRSIAAAAYHSLAATQTGAVFRLGEALQSGAKEELRPILVEGFGGVRGCRVCAGWSGLFAIGEAGELFSWGIGNHRLLGHGDAQNQPSPKRVEALQGVHVSTVKVGLYHVLALTEDGLVYAWGKEELYYDEELVGSPNVENVNEALVDNPSVQNELLPKPVEALRGVRVGSIAAARYRSYAVADTGELCAWGSESADMGAPLGRGDMMDCPLPKPIEWLRRGIKVDAVSTGETDTVAVACDNTPIFSHLTYM
jgi:hypothetical protein